MPAFNLDGDQLLFGDAEGTGVTYRPTLASDRLTHFHHSPVGVGSYGASGGSYGMSGGSYGMGVGCYRTGVGCYGVRVQSQFSLGGESLAKVRREHI